MEYLDFLDRTGNTLCFDPVAYLIGFEQYKIPTRLDVGKIRVDFESSFEGSHPFGAKSIGEIVIDTPCPAIAAAVYNAAGVRVSEMPITPQKVAM